MAEFEGEIKKYSDEWFLSLYLMHGSVEEAIKRYPENLPISTAGFHRLVKKYGLIKSAGRHVSLPETLHFFREKAMEPGAPLERVYKGMPPSFQTSLSTLHRIYQYMERKAVRRHAAALIITSGGDKSSVLIGKEVFGNSRYGKRVGDISVPMSFAKKDEICADSVLRVLQQEVFSDLAAKGKLGRNSEIVRELVRGPEPIYYFDIVDVRVGVYKLELDGLVRNFSSYKLIDHKFENIQNLDGERMRGGVSEMLSIYEDSLHNPYTVKFPLYHVSAINFIAMAQE